MPAPGHGSDARTVLSVSDLNARARGLIEEGLGDVWVEGELSNFRQYRSGHCYFTLKDGDAQVRGVLWRYLTPYVFFEPTDGLLVRVHAQASLYEARGEFQLVAQSLQLAGEGALQRAFDELKQALAAEGLFDAERKRPLPPFPERVGVVTSGDGAALQDVLAVIARRYPLAHVLVCPVRVQGMGAAREIAEAVDAFSASEPPIRPDVLIVGRGGGSLEDLWAFNEEPVARAVAACTIPVVSAVGHETDTTIVDFVADVRAATPSMAAELVVPDGRELLAALNGYARVFRERMEERLARERLRLRALTRSRALNEPPERVGRLSERVAGLEARLERALAHRFAFKRARLDGLRQRLALLDPARPLGRGYAFVERDGRPVRSVAGVTPDAPVRLRFQDGSVEVVRVTRDE